LGDVKDTLLRHLGDAAAPLLVEAREAARLLSISERTLWGLTASGAVPCVRLGRAKRYAMQDLTSYVERLRKGGTSE
jgi:excisionase family DNA binding protein